jgi:2-oxoglutarate dehydrogenase E2 component (dihydrolipoamide succinyltransferase)
LSASTLTDVAAMADVVAPMNEEGTKATILKWGKRVGDQVRRDEPLLELETDKVTVEIPSPASGELAEILKGPDEEVLPGQLLARVRIGSDASTQGAQRDPVSGETEPSARETEPAAGETEPAADAKPRSGGRPLLSPSVRRLLAEHEISVDEVAGTGRNGRVTAEDVVRHRNGAASGHDAASGHGAAPLAAPQKPDVAEVPVQPAGRDASRIPHTPIRRRIAEHMVHSLTQAPHVTTLFEADLTRVLAHRAGSAGNFEAQGARLTLTAYFIAACARALRAHAQVNATFRDDALELHADANIGVGTALGLDGLIVPVLHRAQELNLFGIALRLGQLVAAARAGKLAPADVRGGTFTISNHGVGGSLLAAPIVINQPQVAILGVGKVERRVCALTVDGAEMIAIRSMCYLTLTIDHRAIDAFQANAFLANVVAALEQWPAD